MTTSTRKSNNGIIIVLAVALVAAIGYCIYLKTNGSAGFTTSGSNSHHVVFYNFREPREDDEAVNDMDRYRKQKGTNDPNLVIYDSADIANYFGCVWPTLTGNPKPTGYSSYRWAVGFYFVRKYDSTKKDTVLDFYVTPTLVKGSIGQITDVVDFYKAHGQTQFYQHDPSYPCASLQAGAGGSGSGNSYDAGQLWP